MPEELLRRFLEGVRTTHPAEWIAVVTGVIYVLLIMAQRRLGWLFGAVSAAMGSTLFLSAGRSRPVQ